MNRIVSNRTRPEGQLPRRAKLTRLHFDRLPTGKFLVSNCYKPVDPFVQGPAGSVPVFSGLVAAPSERSHQWSQVKAAGADGRLCQLFDSELEYQLWFAKQTGGPLNN